MYDKSIHKQSSFSRSIANDRKMGAYYTDLTMCERMRVLFSFPEEEYCVLEPSIGDASAVLTVTGKQKEQKENIKIFGVELNSETYMGLQHNHLINYALHADFLNGVKISHNGFSFCFANPPYGKEDGSGKRLEYLFCEKLWNYLNGRGILALVIPYYVLVDETFLKGFFARFQPIVTYRFDDEVYEQFKQVVVIAKKRSSIGYLRQTYDDFFSTIDRLEKLSYLPKEEPEKKISIAPSKASEIEYFTTIAFPVKEASKHLCFSPLYHLFASKVFVPSFVATELGRPIMPLKKDLLYLTATAGGGQGLVGSEEHQDLHLQRGNAKVVTTTEVREENGKSVIVEKSFTKVILKTIENDGCITTLE